MIYSSRQWQTMSAKAQCFIATIRVTRTSVFAAMRDIPAGEELTHDWATTDDDNYSVKCKCGADNCRGTLTGKDWQRPELQKRYSGYFSTYLAKKIARMSKRG